jgi:hypothetical protein
MSKPISHSDLRADLMALIQAGYHVYPAGGGKSPANEGAFYGATTKPEKIEEWLAEGRFTNVYIATGAGFSGVVVIDADRKDTFEWMSKHYGEPNVLTSRGGHWYFAHPRRGKVTSTEIREKLDCKADLAGVIVPPSKGKEWTRGIPDPESLPVLPDELKPDAGAEFEEGERKYSDETVEEAAGVVTEHVKALTSGRHKHLLCLGGALVRNVPIADARQIIETAWKAAEDEELSSRVDKGEVTRELASARERLEANENVYGIPELESADAGLWAELESILSLKLDTSKLPRPKHSKGGKVSPRDDSDEPKRNQADRLIQYALDTGAPLFVDQLGEPHALTNGTQAVPLNSRAYNWLRSLMWDKEERSPTAESLKNAVGMLSAFAVSASDVRPLYTRSAFHEGHIYYWLGPERIAEIDARGWRVRDSAPVLFRTIPNLRELPDPSARGSFDALDALVNLKSERDKRLFRAYVVTLPLEHVQRPIFQPTGVMGSGKSTACRAIKRALDPAAPESVRIDPRDFLQKASHSYVVMLDNQNSLPEWAVDTLCRLVTGEADSKRRHYTNDEDFIYELKRAVLLNGINAPTDRGDAQDRTLPVELERIPDTVRRDEESLWAEFEAEHARVLGAVFDALSGTLRARAGVRLHKRPRLADWGYYAAAVYEVCGWGSAAFLEDWAGVVKAQNQETLDGSAVAQAIISIMDEHDEIEAKPDRLLEMLETEAEKLKINTKRDKSFPTSPRWVYRRIKEVIPLLNAIGILVQRGKDKERKIKLLRVDIKNESNVGNEASNVGNVESNVDAESAEVSQDGENAPRRRH